MLVQIRSVDGGIENKDVSNILDIIDLLDDPKTEKVSFDFLHARLALRSNGDFQIFAGMINFPHFERD